MCTYGRIFLGKNKVLQLALGRNDSEEYKDGLHFVSKVSETAQRELHYMLASFYIFANGPTSLLVIISGVSWYHNDCVQEVYRLFGVNGNNHCRLIPPPTKTDAYTSALFGLLINLTFFLTLLASMPLGTINTHSRYLNEHHS